MEVPKQRRTLGIALLTLIVPGLALSWSLLSPALHGNYHAAGGPLLVLVAACLTHVGVRLVMGHYLGNGQRNGKG